jgi:Zn-dependent protease
MLDLLFTNPFSFILLFGGLIISIGLHEAAHAFMADYLGDPTPRSMGRTTLNPIAHLDPLGTLVILFTGFFGWGKPAPFDPYNLKNPKSDTALIALAGPASNIVIAVALAVLLRFLPLPAAVLTILYSMIILNINLALFNLIPVPPLDGSKVISLFLSNESALRYQIQNNRIILLLLILPLFGSVSIAYLLISPISKLILSLLLPYN